MSKRNYIFGSANTMGIIEQVKQMKIDAACEEARKEVKIETIKRMLALGYSSKNIATAVGVTVSFVERKRSKRA